MAVSAGVLWGQAPPARVDFGRDVLPLLRQNCISCHGPRQQNGGLRLDRRSSVFKAGARRVVPGSTENSFLYHRLTGSEFGPQMPPTGPLRPEQIATIKAWIEQGAEWPESLANEAELPPLNPNAVAMVEALRNGDLTSFRKQVAADAKLLNARGPEGSTPFMYAVLYGNAATVADLLKRGADPNKRNDANATALMWAASDLEKTRLLVEHGADVNAKSDDLRTPLMIAARRPGGAGIVKLLLEHEANANPNTHPESESSPLTEAATAGDADSVQLLMDHGADARAAGQPALTMAITLDCAKCVELLVAKIADTAAYTGSLQDTAAYAGAKWVRMLLDHGADVNAFDPLGRTPLMYAAGSDILPLDVVKLLIEKGADINAASKHAKSGDAGLTVLDIARLRGATPIVDALVEAGAKGGATTTPALRARSENTMRKAVGDSLPLLQRADAGFTPKSGCVSCHNDSLEAMAVGLARKHGFAVDEKTAAGQVKANALMLEKMRDRLHQGFFTPVEDNFGTFVVGYMLVGLGAEGYKADLDTDAAAIYILSRQSADGQWAYPIADMRPPICSTHIGQTVLAMRALQLYAPKGDKTGAEKAIRLAGAWIENARPVDTSDLGWKLQGLAWAGASPAAKRKVLQEMLALQRADGGWSDIATMESTAYATGKALVALEAAGLPVSDGAYQRGVRFLLSTQQEDGSWYVKTRALALQPYFDAGFPHGYDQWISAAGTSWAAMALTLAMPEGRQTASRLQ